MSLGSRREAAPPRLDVDLLPDVTRDEAGGFASDERLLADVPPHHGSLTLLQQVADLGQQLHVWVGVVSTPEAPMCFAHLVHRDDEDEVDDGQRDEEDDDRVDHQGES